MKKQLFILTLIFCSALNYGFAQVTFQKAIGNGSISYANFVQQTTDKGYIVAGTTWSLSPSIYLIKTDSTGDLLWTKIFEYVGQTEGYSAQQTNDDGYIILAANVHTGIQYGWKSLYLIKTNSDGDTLWTRKINVTHFPIYYGNSIQQTNDNGYIIAGTSMSITGDTLNAALIRIDQGGNINWLKTYKSLKRAEFYSVQQTADNGFIMVGNSKYPGLNSANVYLVKTNATGDTLWTRAYGGTDNDHGYSVKQTSDNGYIIAGSSSSFGAGASDVYLIKTDSGGNALWSKTFGGFDTDIGYDVRQTTDGGYILSGTTYSFGNNSAYLIKTDGLGSLEWSKAIVGNNGFSVEQTDDGGYVTAGTTLISGKVDFLLVKTDNLGNTGCNEIDPVTTTGSPATQVAGTSTQIANFNIQFNFRLPIIVGSGGTVTTLCTTVGINEIKASPSMLVSPNPSSGNFVITFPDAINKGSVEIYNAYSKRIFSETVYLTSNREINLGNVPAGMYFVKVSDGSTRYTQKIIIE